MSCIRPLGGYLSIPVDKVEYTGIDYINPEGKVISTVIIDQDKRTIAVDVKELSSIPVSLLDSQPLTTQDGDFVLACTVKNAVRTEYKWLSYSDLVSRISTNEDNIDQIKIELAEEIRRAKSIEEEINSRLTEEIGRATGAEEALNKRLNDLDYSSELTSSETLSQITQEDGLISINKQSIQIEMNQVTSLNNEFVDVRKEFNEADIQLDQKIADEQTRAKGKEDELSQSLNTETASREKEDDLIKESISEINSKIPTQASSTNQLADKDFVNSSISTYTATFRGTYDSLDALKDAEEAKKADNNDYAFVKTVIQTAIEKYDKYTYVATTTEYNPDNWTYEYTLNNSSFTEAQWKAINSNITEDLTSQITANKNNIESHVNDKENPHEVTKAQVGLDKVDNTADEDKPVSTATQTALNDLNTSLTNYVDNLIKSMGTLKGTLEEGTLEVGPGAFSGN